MEHFRTRPIELLLKPESLDEVMRHLGRLWGFTVRMETLFEDGRVELTHETQVEKRKRAIR